MKAPLRRISALRFSNCGVWLAAGCWDQEVSLWMHELLLVEIKGFGDAKYRCSRLENPSSLWLPQFACLFAPKP